MLDLPPALSEQTLIGLTASDYTVARLQPSRLPIMLSKII
ncbi:hypothetical protein [Domibacillus sp. A3M-37]